MDARKKKELLKKFGQRLSEIRTKKGLSLRELAALCDVDASDIHRFEHGQKNPTLATLVDLANGLGVHPKELLDFDI